MKEGFQSAGIILMRKLDDDFDKSSLCKCSAHTIVKVRRSVRDTVINSRGQGDTTLRNSECHASQCSGMAVAFMNVNSY